MSMTAYDPGPAEFFDEREIALIATPPVFEDLALAEVKLLAMEEETILAEIQTIREAQSTPLGEDLAEQLADAGRELTAMSGEQLPQSWGVAAAAGGAIEDAIEAAIGEIPPDAFGDEPIFDAPEEAHGLVSRPPGRFEPIAP